MCSFFFLSRNVLWVWLSARSWLSVKRLWSLVVKKTIHATSLFCLFVEVFIAKRIQLKKDRKTFFFLDDLIFEFVRARDVLFYFFWFRDFQIKKSAKSLIVNIWWIHVFRNTLILKATKADKGRNFNLFIWV